ncbi:hypothetical protein L596_018656 [Steinernema carpocapsae]|uniref:Uncharacterized protein n=1 Tax=Steinernema carpocapsae TaxID=34508 RepID=A0A4U5N5B6_STECR|nr:hypothetical protein L596_018656 [Steinernema carpocapsae]
MFIRSLKGPLVDEAELNPKEQAKSVPRMQMNSFNLGEKTLEKEFKTSPLKTCPRYVRKLSLTSQWTLGHAARGDSSWISSLRPSSGRGSAGDSSGPRNLRVQLTPRSPSGPLSSCNQLS